MTEPELRTILNSVETAIKVYTANEGKLSALEISVKSMLNTIRLRVADELSNVNKAELED